MKVSVFLDDVREVYLKGLGAEEREKESNKLNDMDNLVADLLEKSRRIPFIINNRLSAYLIYLNEKNRYKDVINEKIENNVYVRLNKMNNTIQYLNSIGKKTNTKFILIKSLNIIPYLPVYDIDLMLENSNITTIFEKIKGCYKESGDEEENKINFIPNDTKNYFKLSFHLDVTWDSVKIINIEKEDIWNNCIKILPYVYVNSPKLEASIRVQECLLERLHFNLIDYLFMINHLSEKYSFLFQSRKPLKMYPQFITFSEMQKYQEANTKLLLKNISRWFSWKAYATIVGKVPFREYY